MPNQHITPQHIAPHNVTPRAVHWEWEELGTNPVFILSPHPYRLMRTRGTQAAEVSKLEVSTEQETKPTQMPKVETFPSSAFLWLKVGSP